MSYNSPIQVNFINEIVEQIQKEQETAVLQKVKMVIDVDKDELIRALQYDRGQYKKGYDDGYKKAWENITAIPTIESRPTGAWVGIDEEPYEEWECTNCGNIVFTYVPWEIEEHKYCHQCGAIMGNPFIEGDKE